MNTTSCGRSTLTSASRHAYISRWRRRAATTHPTPTCHAHPASLPREQLCRLWMHSKFEGVYVELSGLCEKYEAACREKVRR